MSCTLQKAHRADMGRPGQARLRQPGRFANSLTTVETNVALQHLIYPVGISGSWNECIRVRGQDLKRCKFKITKPGRIRMS